MTGEHAQERQDQRNAPKMFAHAPGLADDLVHLQEDPALVRPDAA